MEHPGGQSTDGYVYNVDGTLQYKSIQLNTIPQYAYTYYEYDDYKRLTKVTDPVGRETNFYYDAAGGTSAALTHTGANVTRLVQVAPSPAPNKVTQTLYDENLRKRQVTAALGTSDEATTTWTYDAAGNIKTMRDGNSNNVSSPSFGATWTYNYDERDRLINVTDPIGTNRNSNGHTIDYTYDPAGNKLSELPANNQTITYNSYDEMNRLLQKTVGQSPTATAVTYYTWTKAGKLATFKDPGQNIYSYTYDRLNRPVTTLYPNNLTETWLYDWDGNLYQYKNRAGQTQTFVYDVRDRETNYSWSNGSPQPRTLTYDSASRILSCNTTNSFINFTYFDDGSLNTETTWGTGAYGDGIHRTITYNYDDYGNRGSVLYPGMATTYFYAYTARNQLQSLTGGGNLVSYTYDDSGNVVSRTPGTNPASSFTYDAINRVTKITHNFNGANGGAKTINYGYDEVSRRTFSQRDGNGSSGTADGFDYDKNAQLTAFHLNGTLSSGTVSGGTVTNYTMDASGNRTAAGTNSYTSNNMNQYSNVNGLPVSNTSNGGLGNWNFWNYTYDAMDRLTNVSDLGGVVANFFYDGLGRQIAYNTGSGSATILSVWDGWNLVAAYFSGSSTPAIRCVYAGNDLIRGTWPQLIYYYADAQGSTTHTASSTGTLLERYTYDPYGKPTFYTAGGTVLPNGSAYGVTTLYTGQEWYADLGLYDLRNRFYKADWGRFLQPDPIGFAGDPANLYRYVGNSPVNLTDPNGTDPFYGFKAIGSSHAYPRWSNNTLQGHQFVYTTHSDGSLANVYSWGSNPKGGFVRVMGIPIIPASIGFWEHGRAIPENVAAAETLIKIGGGIPVGDASLDPYIQKAFDQLSQEAPHANWLVADSCQQESRRLVDLAVQLQWQAQLSQPQAQAQLNSVLDRASYRDARGLIYDANGSVIGNASSLFRDSANVSGIAPAGIMSVSWPSAQMPSAIQP